jgi:hypothetical protein
MEDIKKMDRPPRLGSDTFSIGNIFADRLE